MQRHKLFFLLVALIAIGCTAQPTTVAREGVFCGQGTVLRGTVCVATQPTTSCGQGTIRRGNECISARTQPTITCGQGTILRGAECVAIKAPSQPSISDAQIRRMMIDASIRGYSGNCPCPYNRASNGSQCGGRSAYSRPGGASPLCYDSDVSDAMVNDYRRRLGR